MTSFNGILKISLKLKPAELEPIIVIFDVIKSINWFKLTTGRDRNYFREPTMDRDKPNGIKLLGKNRNRTDLPNSHNASSGNGGR